MSKKVISVGLILIMVLALASCGSGDKDMGETPQGVAGQMGQTLSGATRQLEVSDSKIELSVTPVKCISGFEYEVTDFSLRLFKAVEEAVAEGENVLLSPASVMTALAMTTWGADDKTLEQMLDVFTVGDVPYLSAGLGESWRRMKEDEAKVETANSVWFRDEDDRLKVDDTFLMAAREYFNAQVFKSAFDNRTVKDINNWCADNTDGMIDKIIEKIDYETLMYLINAVSFEGKWENPYQSYGVRKEMFICEDGTEQMMDMMYSTERYFLQDDMAKGLLKPYKGDYTFMAILPDEGVSISDYLETLTDDHFRELIEGAKETNVAAAIPKFHAEMDKDLIPDLKKLGITDLFDSRKADLTKMATSPTGNIYVSAVQHKALIDVDTEGTKAAAVTVVEAGNESAMEVNYQVYLNRPFIYAIVHTDTGIPLFLGTFMGK